MRSTYLAIFGAAPATFADLKKLLTDAPTPEERAEAERIAGEALTNPEKLSPDNFEKIFRKDGKVRAAEIFEKKLEPLVNKFLDENPDIADIAWGVFHVMTSDDFFAQLTPDVALEFKSRYDIDLRPEAILLPDSSWAWDEQEKIMNEHRCGYIYVFFSIDA